MARPVGPNTGRGNYAASKFSGTAKQLKEGLASFSKIKHPNRQSSTSEYKRNLKKESGSNAE